MQALLDQRELVAIVIHNEVLLQADCRSTLAEQAGTDGVERPHPHLLASDLADQLRQSLAHLVRGLVRERDRQNVARPHAPPPGQERDTVRQDARLAGTRPGEDQQRSVGMHDGLALRFVQPLQQRVVVIDGERRGRPFGRGSRSAGKAGIERVIVGEGVWVHTKIVARAQAQSPHEAVSPTEATEAKPA